MKTIEERKQLFKQDLWLAIGQNFNNYTKEMLIEFTDYWCEISPRGKKMRFEKEKTFDPKRRIATWKNHSLQWNKEPEKEETFPSYFQKSLWQRLQGDRMIQYKDHLKRLGWFYQSSPGGTFWRSPEGKMIWL